MVPTGYSESGTLFLKIRTASFSFSESAFLMYVFLTLVPSRIQVKDFSETVTSCAYTLHTIERNKVNAVPVKRVVIVFMQLLSMEHPGVMKKQPVPIFLSRRIDLPCGYQRPACAPPSTWSTSPVT